MKLKNRFLAIFLAFVLVVLGSNGLTVFAQDEAYKWDMTFLFENEADLKNKLEECYGIINEMAKYVGRMNSISKVKEYLDLREKAYEILFGANVYTSCLTSVDIASQSAAQQRNYFEMVFKEYNSVNLSVMDGLKSKSAAFWEKLLADKNMKPYYNELRRFRDEMEHMPSDEVLQAINTLQPGSGLFEAFNKLLYVDIIWPEVTTSKGDKVTLRPSAYTAIIKDEKDQNKRLEMRTAYTNTFGQFKNIFAQNLYNSIRLNVASAQLFKYNSSLEMSIVAEEAPSTVYNTLMKAAEKAIPLNHKYMELRKETLGLKNMYMSDLALSISEDVTNSYTYEEAKDILIKALAPLGEEYVNMLKRAFDERWIDVYPKEGKESGAYSANAPGHSVILMNYTDDYNSVSTLAHELGHAVHQTMGAKAQESLYDGNPTIFTTEVASTLNELLLADYMYKNAKNDAERLFFLNEQMDLLNGTFFTQAMFAEFEYKIYDIVEKGGVFTEADLNQIWIDLIKKYNGDAIVLTEEEKYGWIRIPHFYFNHYVYKYATSISFACDIAERIIAGEPNAVEGYIAFLKAADSGKPDEIFKLANIDINSPDVIDSFGNRYEKLINQTAELIK